MKFEEVLPALKKGKIIKRLEWIDHRWWNAVDGIYIGGEWGNESRPPECGFLRIGEHLLADDWIITNEKTSPVGPDVYSLKEPMKFVTYENSVKNYLESCPQ